MNLFIIFLLIVDLLFSYKKFKKKSCWVHLAALRQCRCAGDEMFRVRSHKPNDTKNKFIEST